MDQPEYHNANYTPLRVADRIQGMWESMRARERATNRQNERPLEEREVIARNDRHRRVMEARRNRVGILCKVVFEYAS